MAERLQTPPPPVPREESDLVAPAARVEVLAAQARGAEGQHGTADAVSTALLQLRGHGTREAADAIRRLLEGGTLEGLTDAEGRSCRAVAVEVLLSFGFPYALEVTPEDLAHYRAHGRPRRLTAERVSAGLLVLTLSGFQLAMAFARAEPTPLVLGHAALAIAAVAAAVVARRGLARWLSLGALVFTGALGLAAAASGIPSLLVPGLGALAAAALLSRRPVG